MGIGASGLSSSECSYVGSLFTHRKRMAHGVFDTFASHASLVRDVTEPDCWAQNGSTHDCVFVTPKHVSLTNKTRK